MDKFLLPVVINVNHASKYTASTIRHSRHNCLNWYCKDDSPIVFARIIATHRCAFFIACRLCRMLQCSLTLAVESRNTLHWSYSSFIGHQCHNTLLRHWWATNNFDHAIHDILRIQTHFHFWTATLKESTCWPIWHHDSDLTLLQFRRAMKMHRFYWTLWHIVTTICTVPYKYSIQYTQ